MASNLYEVLDLDRSASPEDVRKAYRKKALATHPDRLPPNTSETDRQRANEQFRLVNNAYEVLNDAQNRKLYDQYGVWPPPAADPTPRASSSQDSFAGFDSHPFFGPQRGFGFTDPFELFNSLFGDIHRHFDNDPFFDDFPAHRSPFDSMFGSSPFGSPFGPRRDPFSSRSMLSPFGSSFPFGGTPLLDMMNGGMGDMGGDSNVRSYSSITQSIGMNGQWVSQSKMTRTINGRTETITKKRDAQGNEHITYSSPDGERYTINGIEQPKPNDRYLPPSSSHPPPPPAVAAPPPPPAVDYGRYGRSTSAYQAAPVYSVPIASGAPQPHAVPVQKRYSTAEAYQNQHPSDGVRRSSTSSSRRHHHSDRERSDRHHRDSTSSRHSREHARERVPDAYAYQPQYDGAGTKRDPVDLTASPPPAHHNAYVPHSRDTPSRQSRHSKHESRSGHARDEEHHEKGWTHARRWLSGLSRLFKWPHHHHHHRDEAEGSESRERDTAVSQ